MIDTPMDLMAAIAFILEKEQLPDDWSAEDWESLDGDFKSRAFVSSKVQEARFLDRAQGLLFDHIAEVRDVVDTPRGPETVLRVSGKADFVRAMREFMIEEGMATEDEMMNTNQKDVRVLHSNARLSLIFDTNIRQAYGYGQWKQGMVPAVLEAFPAARLTRMRDVSVPRPRHEVNLGEIRHKTDPWWKDYINAEDIGGFNVPWGPYGFNSGCDREDVPAAEWEAMNKGTEPEEVNPETQPEPGFNDDIWASLREIDPEIRKRLIMELDAKGDERIRIAEENVRPIIDFDHKHSGPAAAIPTAFRYEEGKGIVLALDWTRAGREAIEGKDFSYFSPEFLINDDGTPGGLPSRGPLGALVNNPAFREIPRIAASDSDGEEDPTNPTPTKPTMKRIAAHFKLDEGRSDLEDLILTAITASDASNKEKFDELTRQITALTTERDKLKGDLGEAATKVEAAAKEKAESLVAAACADGRIAPKDEKTKGFFVKLITAGDTEAVEALAALPKRAGAVPKIVQASDADEKETGEHAFIAKAKRLVEAKSAENIDAAMDLVVASEPELYSDYCRSLHIAAAE